MAASAGFKDDLLGAIPSLRAFAVSLAQNADKADDLVQETLVKAWDKQTSFQPGTNLKAWLFTILHNTFRNDRRSASRQPVDVDSEVVESLPLATSDDDPERRLIRSTLDADLQLALEALPEAYREAVWLRDVEDCSYQDIARILAVPVGTVMSRISRGRKQLYEHLVAARARAEAATPSPLGPPGASSGSTSS
jgi:RNA polymerase sigma-70 factor, ECF subfamily